MYRFSLSALLVSMLFLVLSCEKESSNNIEEAIQRDSIYDIDSNVYDIVKIGDKWWMAEDLRVTRFRDSSLIPQVQDQQGWLTAGAAYCIFQSNPQANSLLYNVHAIRDPRALAPAGWHVATDEEWQELEAIVGVLKSELMRRGWRGIQDPARRIKTEDRKGWMVDEQTWPQNSVGLSLSGIGGRVKDGNWCNPGLFSQGFWWSVSADSNFYRALDYKYNQIFREQAQVGFGLAVRCVKD
jgi:uncharacterized protein (TIGR02145 family)